MKKCGVIFLSIMLIFISLNTNVFAEDTDYNTDSVTNGQNETKYEFTDGKLTQVKDDNGFVVETNKYENGMRIYKNGDSQCKFVYDSYKNLLSEERDGVKIEYNYEYNKSGDYYTIIGFSLNGATYTFIRNDEKKIEGICDEDQNLLAKYKYNGNTVIEVLRFVDNNWVDCNDNDFIGNFNKIRNVFAYYDDETNLYYENGCFYDATTNKSVRESNPDAGIATLSYEDDLDWEVHDWQQSLLNDDTFNAACSHSGYDWYEYYDTVEVLARTIYGEQTHVIRDQDGIAWVIRNRAWWNHKTVRDVITASNQFSALCSASSLCTQSQDSGDMGWCNAVYAACVLCTTLDEYDWEVLNEKPSGMGGQEMYRASWCYQYFSDEDPMYYDGTAIEQVWIAGYGSVDSTDELYNIIDDYWDRNIFFDYL